MSPKLTLAGLTAALVLLLLYRLPGESRNQEALGLTHRDPGLQTPATTPVLDALHRQLVLEIAEREAIVGRIVDDRDRPVPGARIECEEASILADDRGEFRLEVHPDDAGWVRAEHPGHLPARALPEAGKPLVLQLIRGTTLRGRLWILDAAGERTLLPGHGISARADRFLPSRTVSSEAGEYELPVLPGTNWIVAVEVPGHSTWSETLFVGEGGLVHDIVIAADRYRQVEVRVLDRTTELPIEGALLLCDGEEAGRTDRQGLGLAPVQMGIYHEVRARHPGYVDRFQRLQILPGSPDPQLEFELFEGGTLYGRVFLPDGRVAVGADVQLVHDRTARGGGRTPGVEDTREPRVPTDGEGWFRFSQLASRKGRLVAGVVVTLAGHARYRSEFVTITHDGKVGPLTCSLVPGADLWGTVRIDGRPGPATLRVENTGETLSTDERGRYRATHLPVGRARLHVHGNLEPCLAKEVPVTIPPEGTQLDIDVDLGLETAPLTGRVATARGQPIAGVRVHAVAEHLGHEHSYGATTAEDGTYSMEIPLRGPGMDVPYEVFLMRWNRERECVAEVLPPAQVDLSCRASGTVTFTLEEHGRGRAPRDFAVFGEYLAAEDQPEHWFSSDSRGGRSIVPSGPGKLFIEGYPHLETWSRDIDLEPGEVLDLGHIVLHPRKE